MPEINLDQGARCSGPVCHVANLTCSTFARELGFYALRHAVTKLKHARVPQEDVAAITGRSENNRSLS